jgi:vacuolar-type H+-ATPase subunit F/Vma7
MTDKALVVIASPGLSVGFELAGLEVREAADGVEAAKQIVRLVDEDDAGVVIIDQTLYGALPDEMRRSLQRAATPVVIPVPGPDWTEESSAHEYIVDILRRAIGYRVRLQ